MRIYLDNCALNRPFDDQSQIRIRVEAEAKLFIQDKVKSGSFELVWSYILDYENAANPFEERKRAIQGWKKFGTVMLHESKRVVETAEALVSEARLSAKDALHVACAIQGECDYYITTDDDLIRKLPHEERIRIVDPVSFVRELGL